MNKSSTSRILAALTALCAKFHLLYLIASFHYINYLRAKYIVHLFHYNSKSNCTDCFVLNYFQEKEVREILQF